MTLEEIKSIKAGRAAQIMRGTIRLHGQDYDVTAQPCLDCPSLAVLLDLGNGRPEHIGYAETWEESIELAREEIERLTP